MSEYVLKSDHLTKIYKTDYALNRVNMSIKKGAIYGFIGQNGAGKSTLIRILNGLATPTDGSIELFGKRDPQDLSEARKRMGSIIEGPALYPNMTARENLETHRLLRGIPGKACIETRRH